MKHPTNSPLVKEYVTSIPMTSILLDKFNLQNREYPTLFPLKLECTKWNTPPILACMLIMINQADYALHITTHAPPWVTGFSDLPTALNLCLLLFAEECRIAVMNKEKMSTGLPRRHLNWTLKKNEWHETYSFSTYSVIWIYFLCSTNSCSNFLIS